MEYLFQFHLEAKLTSDFDFQAAIQALRAFRIPSHIRLCYRLYLFRTELDKVDFSHGLELGFTKYSLESSSFCITEQITALQQ